MPRFLIPWRMSGVVEVWAGSHEEAQASFDELDVGEIASTNENLDQDPPKSVEEVLAEFRRDAEARIRREAIADTAEEQRHG